MDFGAKLACITRPGNSFGLMLIMVSSLLTAQEQAPAKPPRFDLTPLLGYRTSISFETQAPSGGANPPVILEQGPSYGFAFGFRLDEKNLVEVRWARQDTHIHLEATKPPSKQKVTLDQFHGDFTHEYILDHWPPWARPFVVGSVGATHLSNGTSGGFTRFSFGLGGGIKVFPRRHFGFRIQAEWLPIWLDPEVKTLVCGGGCVVRVGGTLSSQGEVTMGPLLRF